MAELAPRAEPAPRARVLVADDEESMRHGVERGLRRHGFLVASVAGGEQAIELWGTRRHDVAVVDLKMPGTDGIAVLARLREHDPDAIVILMTAYGTIASAVQAMRAGAFDYITKPFEIDELVLLIERALEHRTAVRESRELRRMLDARTSHGSLIGQSPAMKRVFQTIDLLEGSAATVLISGESGTGKELVARSIHAVSKRSEGPFVPIHCAALPDSLLESELFGHAAGAFTGAAHAKRGRLAEADGGTLFLDEVGDISLAAQAKLERFLSEREFTPLGATTAVPVDVRVLAATNRDLARAAQDGEFRQELLWRLNVVPLHLPPLRARREDVPALVNHYLQRFAEAQKQAVPRCTVDAMVALTSYSWPGNIRELQNAVERIVVLNAGKAEIDAGDLPEEIRSPIGEEHARVTAFDPEAHPMREAMLEFERVYLTRLLTRTGGNISETARLAGISRGHLHRKIKQLGLRAVDEG